MYLFLLITLYMFRAHSAHHQERQIVPIQPLVTVILCWWPRCVQVVRRVFFQINTGIKFYILLTVHHVTILRKWSTWRTNFFYVFISIYNSLHVSSTSCSSSGETNCINTASGNSHSMLVAEMCAGWKKTKSVFFQPAHISATNIEWLLPEAVLVQSVSPDDEHDVLETCREL